MMHSLPLLDGGNTHECLTSIPSQLTPPPNPPSISFSCLAHQVSSTCHSILPRVRLLLVSYLDVFLLLASLRRRSVSRSSRVAAFSRSSVQTRRYWEKFRVLKKTSLSAKRTQVQHTRAFARHPRPGKRCIRHCPSSLVYCRSPSFTPCVHTQASTSIHSDTAAKCWLMRAI